MPNSSAADSIRVLVSTDNHVGYNERDPIRGDDSWRSFEEIMRLAKTRDVDMVLLAGDLYHDNNPSRKAQYHVTRIIRENCFGDKPCELEFISDGTEHFSGAFNHVNYEDENINVSIPIFSIHGNHDDPSGEGNFAALDLLQASGLLNYYGRVPEVDNVRINALCLQKGRTKLALYGLSNVRDERLFRTFRDGGVTWNEPEVQAKDFFNLMSIHQNHHAYTETGFIPEKFLSSDMDLIIWGHEHECKIDPTTNPEKGFKVMQPGSSVATSLDRTEAVPKYVAILDITGTDFAYEKIRLRTVRPFIWRDIVLKDQKEMLKLVHANENRTKITQFLEKKVDALIVEANQRWHDMREENPDELDADEDEPPLPLVRLRVDYSAPAEGGEFQVDNPQRFSNRFVDKVANVNDVVQFTRKKTAARAARNLAELPEESAAMAELSFETVKVDQLVQEFLTAQALSILPQNTFSNAVSQFVDKDDKHAMEDFLKDSLQDQVGSLLKVEGEEKDDDDDEAEINTNQILDAMEAHKIHMEEQFDKGEKRLQRTIKRKPQPATWNSDADGPWADSVNSLVGPEEEGQTPREDNEDDADDVSITSSVRPTPARGRGSRGGRAGKAATGTMRKPAAKKAPAKSAAPAKGKKKAQPFADDSDEEMDNDVVMIDSDGDVEESQGLFVSQTSTRPSTRKAPPARAAAAPKGKAAAAATGRQMQISFGSQATNPTSSRAVGRAPAAAPAKKGRMQEPSEDEISDDDAFEPPPANQQRARTRR